MTRRVAVIVLAVLALGSSATACGGSSKYTVRQAVIDLPTYEHTPYNTAHAKCVAEYLFAQMSPGQVKTSILGGDLGTSPAVAAGEQACAGTWW